MADYALVSFLLRMSVGASMLSHGLVRLPKLGKFSEWMVKEFSGSLLPDFLVLPFSLALPFLEFLIGVLILSGLFTRYAAAAGCVLMSGLLFGSGMIEEWGAMPSQLLHSLFFVLILALVPYNTLSADHVFKKNRRKM